MRLTTFSLRRMLETWTFTVCSDTFSSPAICLFSLPSTIIVRMRSCCGDREAKRRADSASSASDEMADSGGAQVSPDRMARMASAIAGIDSDLGM